MARLLVISHTEHFLNTDGTVVGLNSTVREIDHLAQLFDSVVHIAMLYKGEVPKQMSPYSAENIRFEPLDALGGPKFLDKLKYLGHMRRIIKTLGIELKNTDYFQFRAPTGIGMFCIPYLMYSANKTRGWFKYAGNWDTSKSPWTYKLQKYFLEHQSKWVTINGQWPNQKSHCISFENPCLTEVDIHEGKKVRELKTFNPREIQFCFIGRLEEAKGFDLFMEAFSQLSSKRKQLIRKILVIGDGPLKEVYEVKKILDLNIEFLGVQGRDEVIRVLNTSDFIILPSHNEGFPKVIAEAVNYGCVPILSNLPASSQYFRHLYNAIVLSSISAAGLLESLNVVFNLSEKEVGDIRRRNTEIIEKFSYKYYLERLNTMFNLSGVLED